MADNVKNSKPKMVDKFIPRGYSNDDPNLFVSINGYNYILPRGKTSTIPAYVAEEIDRSQAAQERYNDTVDKMRSRGE